MWISEFTDKKSVNYEGRMYNNLFVFLDYGWPLNSEHIFLHTKNPVRIGNRYVHCQINNS